MKQYYQIFCRMNKNLIFDFLLIFIITHVFGSQHQYQLATENFSLDYFDHRYLDVTVGNYKINQDMALNMTFKIKFDVPEDMKMSGRMFKLILDEYRLPVTQVNKSLKDVLEMEVFDFQSLFIHHAKPPLVWPIEKEVTYRLSSWVPDITKYPANIPEVKLKIVATQWFANKTKILIISWHFNIKYHK